MSQERYRLGFHIAPHTGWLNDPNGLCYFRGMYHAFFQYNPQWPQSDTKHWRHFVSKDLMHWSDLGTALLCDIAEDRNGVYSGSALIRPKAAADGAAQMWLYYTGNVINPNDPQSDFDYVHSGREANEILVTSDDALHFSEKQVLLRNADYPDVCTLHVRDPKVWEQNARFWMLLGARDQDDEGFALLYGSNDGLEWRITSQIYSHTPFGYMWECPNIIQLDGYDYLAICPQGLPSEKTRWYNRYQAGYIPLIDSILTTELVDETAFIEWDLGFDFYAPQTFVDERGRTILIGWMGTFGDPWDAAPDGLTWCHCLTVPRELTRQADGLLHQMPVIELNALRAEMHILNPSSALKLPEHRADLVMEGITKTGNIVLDDVFELAFDGSYLHVRFKNADVSAGRPSRSIPLTDLHDLRLLIDTSALECYINQGTIVFSTRWFPTSDTLTITSSLPAQARVWPLENALAHAYDNNVKTE